MPFVPQIQNLYLVKSVSLRLLLCTKKELYSKITKQQGLIFLSHSSLFLLSELLIVTIFQLPIVAGGVKGSFLLCYYALYYFYCQFSLNDILPLGRSHLMKF